MALQPVTKELYGHIPLAVVCPLSHPSKQRAAPLGRPWARSLLLF